MSRIQFFQSLLDLFAFFSYQLLALTEINIVRWKQSMILRFSLQLFFQNIIGVDAVDAGLDGKI